MQTKQIMKQSKLKMIIAKLKLKELEVIDRLSKSHNDYIVRVIIDPISYIILAINGDWEKVSGFKESDVLGKNWQEFIDPIQSDNSLAITDNSEGFTESSFSIKNSDGGLIPVKSKSKFYSDINATVSICKVAKAVPKSLKIFSKLFKK